MFIQTEQTPNPASLKFLPGCEVMISGVAEFLSKDAAAVSPLAQSLFAVTGVQSVFLGQDFITITKAEAGDWQALKPAILGVIMDHFTQGKAVILGEHVAAATQAGGASAADETDPIVRQIKEILETRVRPVVAQDGGDIVFSSFENGVVYLQMRGACAGCPSSTMTLKAGIENLLRHFRAGSE
jgi:Fe-S cluster biogenesis protein NfuA